MTWNQVYHFIGYPNRPLDAEYVHAYQELAENNLGVGYVLIPADEKAISHFCNLGDENET